jgi:hypothetical protein
MTKLSPDGAAPNLTIAMFASFRTMQQKTVRKERPLRGEH